MNNREGCARAFSIRARTSNWAWVLASINDQMSNYLAKAPNTQAALDYLQYDRFSGGGKRQGLLGDCAKYHTAWLNSPRSP